MFLRFLRIAAVVLLSACTSATLRQTVLPAAAGARAALPHDGIRRNVGLFFISDLGSDAVWICPGNTKAGILPPTGQLQDVSNPVQIAVDRAGTVYVADAQTDASGSGAVTVYPRGQTVPSLTLTAGLNTSTGVAVDSHGNVYVSNKYLASVEMFAKGSTKPGKTITANLRGPDGLAVDGSDDLFIADGSANDVLEVVHGTSTPQSLHLERVSRPVGVAVDAQGRLYVSNLIGPLSYISVYASGSKAPLRTFPLTDPSQNGTKSAGEPGMLTVAPDGTLIAPAFWSLSFARGSGWQPSHSPSFIAGFARSRTRPSWYAYGGNVFPWAPWDVAFQPPA